METISTYLERDHRERDQQYLEAEQHASCGRWQEAGAEFGAYRQALELHMTMEEKVVFPALERALGGNNGPTSVMRNEHAHLRQVAASMSAALAAQDSDLFFNQADMLRLLMRQHNLKEESILYPMAERVLADSQHAIVAAMEEMVHLAPPGAP